MTPFINSRIAAAIFTLFCLSETALGSSFEKLKEMGMNPKSVVEMPVDGMVAYETQNGEVLFMTTDGRYVFKGTATDVWNKKILETGSDVRRSAHTIPLEDMEIDFDQLDALTVGTGNKVVHVITDPRCGACKKLTDLMPGLSEEYTFKILALPALGDLSRDYSKRIACETDRNVATQALLSHTVDQLNPPTNCNMDAYKQALLLADYIGVREVPFLIGPNDRVHRGLPSDLNDWLDETSSFIATAPAPIPVQKPIKSGGSGEPNGNSTAAPLSDAGSLNNRIRNALK